MQITIYYNSDIEKHKKTVAYAESVSEVLAIPFESMPQAYNVWMNIWQAVQSNPKIIFDQNHDQYQELIQDQIFNFEDWRNIAIHNKDIIAHPIAIIEKRVLICEESSSIQQFISPAI